MDANPHHLVMGELTDFLTGKRVADTHDERYHQKLAKLLVQTLGYERNQIRQKEKVKIRAGNQAAEISVDFLVSQGTDPLMLVQYAPGSLVTRRLSNLALSRVVSPFQIPVVVTANGEDAEIIDGVTGKVIGQGLDQIPGPHSSLFSKETLPPISPELFDKASRIVFACEVDGACLTNDDFRCDTWYCYPPSESGKS